jgi:aryl-alcohol dehydrogenase-like predicted oxidoreductase
MNYRKFGNTSLLVSEIGFGAWAIGGGAMVGNTAIGWGNVNDDVSEKAIFAALNTGINFFDTADIYGLGHSESILGKTIGNKQDIIIATKVGNVARNSAFTIDYTKEYIMLACENSLKRLKRETIDYYQLHTARLQHLQNGECIDAMQQLQKQGKIKYWGLSVNTFEPITDAEFLIEKKLGSGFQLVLNLINKNAIPLLQNCYENGYGIIVRMALQFGVITGKFDEAFSFANNDHRQKRVTTAIVQETNKTLETVWQLCTKYNCTKTQLALSYILSYNQVSTVIAGIRTAEQVQLNTQGLIVLTNEDKQLIEQTNTSQLMQMILQKG